MSFSMILGIVIFLLVYVVITTEVFNKTAVALLGAMVMVMAGILDQETAYRDVDWNVIFLLIGMMVIVSITRKTGLFQYVAIKVSKIARGEPIAILILISLVTAVFSAFLDNVTTVLIIVPITILIAVELGISPIPFILSLAMASNIGGTATLIGDPPNIMIGSAAGLSFLDFITHLAPIVLILLTVFSVVIYFLFNGKMHVSNERKARILEFDEKKAIEDPVLLVKSLTVLGAVIVGFLIHSSIGLEPSTIALAGAAVMLIISGHKEVEAFFAEIEWTTIFFFLGLFMLVGGLVELGVISELSKTILDLTAGHLKITAFAILWMSGIFSAFVDNIPFVATMVPLIHEMGSSLGSSAIAPLWWTLSLGACLGGNGTLIGASANVVAAGISGKNGFHISFWEFTKYGLLIMFLSLILSSAYVLIAFL